MPEQGRENTFTVFIERNPYRWIHAVQPMLLKGQQYSVKCPGPAWAGLPVLSHIHDHPVFGIDILSNQILKHDKSFHEEVLQRTKEWLEENWGTRHKPSWHVDKKKTTPQ